MPFRNFIQHLFVILAFVAMLGGVTSATAQIDSTKVNAAGALPESYCPNLNDQWYSSGQMPAGYYKSGANCIPIPTCAWGTQWNGSWCADICGAGTRWNGSWCESICGPGTQWNGSWCAAVCPAGTQWNGSSCVSVCGSGYTWNGAGCVFDVTQKTIAVYRTGADYRYDSPIGIMGFYACTTTPAGYCSRILTGTFSGRWQFWEFADANNGYMFTRSGFSAGMYLADIQRASRVYWYSTDGGS